MGRKKPHTATPAVTPAARATVLASAGDAARDDVPFAALATAALENSPQPWLLLDPFRGHVVFANQAAEGLFQRHRKSLQGAPASQLYPQERGELYVFSDEVLHRGFGITRELTLLRPDGESFRLEHTGIRVQSGGQVYLFICIADLAAMEQRDISAEAANYHRKGAGEWRHAEHFFRELERDNQLILSAAGEGIYGVNAEGFTTFLNPAAENMLGYKASELIGQEMHTVVHYKKADGSDYPQVDCPIYNAFRQRAVKTIDDEVFWCKNGKALPVEYTSTPIVDHGIVVGAVVVFRDISKRKKNEEQLRALLADNAQLKERLELENAYLQEEIRGRIYQHNIIGTSESLRHTLSQIDVVADTNANVLINGESGTGKELVAHAIHQASSRNDRPLIRVNCAAIPRELFESEFFGHVRGAFSGALRDRIGRFELADGGTIFLDEVGEIPLDLQSKLLRVLQDQRFERVGEERTREISVRVIAATNRDLSAEVDAGRFREDLYFRLNVFPIDCKPLRHRPDDIPLLAEHFLEKACVQLNLRPLRLSKAHVRALRGYSWPGNVRELQNVIERAAILARNSKLKIELPQHETQVKHRKDNSAPAVTGQSDPDMPPIQTAAEMALLEKRNIERALKACNGKVSGARGAAALLGMKPTTLYSRVKSLGIGRTPA